MPLISFLEEFGLDLALIERDRDMSAAFARAHSILLSDRRSADAHFRNAGDTYCRLGNAYGFMMFACADMSKGDMRERAREFRIFEGRPSERLQLSYFVLAAAANGWEHPARLVPRRRVTITTSGSSCLYAVHWRIDRAIGATAY